MKRNFGDMSDWRARDVQKALDRTNWEITIDNDMDMYTCPKCECRMIAGWYDLAVGTRGYNYCPCGVDLEPYMPAAYKVITELEDKVENGGSQLQPGKSWDRQW